MLVLASGSPRRAALLKAAGIAFEVEVPDIDEDPLPDEAPDCYVLRIARVKADAVGCRKPGKLILGADTTVVVDGGILGKPADENDARRMLQRLSGRGHEVLTGVVLRNGQRVLTAVASTEVRFLPITVAEINSYIASGEPLDKAGAYAIQGLASRFVERIDGSYTNVVGLPVGVVCDLLRQVGSI